MFNFFISIANAQEAGADPQAAGGGMGPFMMLIIIFVIFYFIVIRPQQKQQKRLKKMIADAKKGDEVITNSGIHGKIVDVKDNNLVMLQIANNVVIKMERASIQHIMGYEVDPKKAACSCKGKSKDKDKNKKAA